MSTDFEKKIYEKLTFLESELETLRDSYLHAYPVATGLPFVAQSNACPSSPMRRLAHVIW